MPRPPPPLPDMLTGAFRTCDALAAGVSSGRLGASDLVTPFRGVKQVAGSASADDAITALYSLDEEASRAIWCRVRAHALVLPAHAFYTGHTALALHGFELLHARAAMEDDLHVGVIAPHRAVRRPGIRSDQVRSALAHVSEVEGVPVATPATAWAMLARAASVRDLVKIGDALVRIPRDRYGRRPDLQRVTVGQLQAAVDAGPRRGIERLRRALGRISEHSMSMLETDWRENLVGAGLPEPELDVEIRDGRGILLGVADGAFRMHRVAVEVEGDHHRVSRIQWARDIEKHAAYTAAGWHPLRLTSQHIRSSPGLDVAMLRQVLALHE